MFGKRKWTTFTHDEVIQYAHFDQGQGLFQPCSQDVIRLAGFCTT